MVVTVPERPVGFVLQLRLKQLALEQGDGAFSALLGIDPSHWWRLRHGKREVTTALVLRALSLWPGDFGHLRLDTLLPPEEHGDQQAG